MKHYLALALYYFGDGISRLVEKFDWHWLHPLYTKVMLLSGDLDTENRIWQREPYMAGGKCRYSTNWMGVTNLEWYRKRGLLKKRTITFTEQSLTVKHGNNKPGDTIEVDEPTVYYSCGRIDVRGGDTNVYYGDEIGVPPMRSEDWERFGEWVRTVETDFMWTLDQLVEMYERKNPKIRWADNEQTDRKIYC